MIVVDVNDLLNYVKLCEIKEHLELKKHAHIKKTTRVVYYIDVALIENKS